MSSPTTYFHEVSRVDGAPCPSWCSAFRPAHTIDPLSKTRHMKSLDALMEATVLPVGSVSEIGEVCEVVLPSPN